MGDRVDSAVLPGARDQVARLCEVMRDRFVADDVETRVEGGLAQGIVRVIRGHDRDRFGAIRPLLFPIEQLGERAVAPRRVEAHGDAALPGALSVAGEHAADHAPVTVELGRGAMHFADPCTRSAADDREAQGTAETGS